MTNLELVLVVAAGNEEWYEEKEHKVVVNEELYKEFLEEEEIDFNKKVDFDVLDDYKIWLENSNHEDDDEFFNVDINAIADEYIALMNFGR